MCLWRASSLAHQLLLQLPRNHVRHGRHALVPPAIPASLAHVLARAQLATEARTRHLDQCEGASAEKKRHVRWQLKVWGASAAEAVAVAVRSQAADGRRQLDASDGSTSDTVMPRSLASCISSIAAPLSSFLCPFSRVVNTMLPLKLASRAKPRIP